MKRLSHELYKQTKALMRVSIFWIKFTKAKSPVEYDVRSCSRVRSSQRAADTTDMDAYIETQAVKA